MIKPFDDILTYRGNTKAGSACHLRVFINEHTCKAIVILAELDGNPGFSVTNGAELIREEALRTIWQLRSLPPEDVSWIEHYPERDSFDVILFPGPKQPTIEWRPCSRAAVEALITPEHFEPIPQHV